MTDEIKDITNYIKKQLEKTYCIEFKEFKKVDLNKLLDYITNLQKENERLKELNICVGCENNPDYKSRIDKALEIIERNENKAPIDEALKILKGE